MTRIHTQQRLEPVHVTWYTT